jgi:hypothetical protein
MPSSGIIRPVLAKRSQDQSNSFQPTEKPNFRPAASTTCMPSGMTSRPMPSPATTAIL